MRSFNEEYVYISNHTIFKLLSNALEAPTQKGGSLVKSCEMIPFREKKKKSCEVMKGHDLPQVDCRGRFLLTFVKMASVERTNR